MIFLQHKTFLSYFVKHYLVKLLIYTGETVL